jgi:asparagine synthase (glutamine-hydrolysing)
VRDFDEVAYIIMCGISAFSSTQPFLNAMEVVHAIADKQRHRGRDNFQVKRVSNSVVLGHNRLSILDLSERGTQPLVNEDQSIYVVCNGEIYNHKELRAWLEKRGHTFYSHSDTEVLVHVYEELGSEMLERLVGMFAFCLYDARKDILFCARDRVGKKPLVYAETRDGLAVGSEIAALSGAPGCDLRIDPNALGLYLLRNLRHVPDPFTFYQGIRRLPPAHGMIIQGGKISRMWKYSHVDFGRDEYASNKLLDTFDLAVKRRMEADVEIGAMLSGGVDSTAIVQSMEAQGAKEVRTYALGMNREDDELVRARYASEFLGTRHRELYFDADKHHSMLLDLLRIYGEPLALLPAVFTYELSSAMRKDGIPVAMSGIGADELFYGYTSSIRQAQFTKIQNRIPGFVGSLISCARPLLPQSLLRQAAAVFSAPPGGRKKAIYLDESRSVLKVLMKDSDIEGAINEVFESVFANGAPENYIDESQYVGLVMENAHSVTTTGDLSGMAAHVEIRCPFLDQDLIDLAFQIPWEEKVSVDRQGDCKVVLKNALKERLPERIVKASKKGFGYHIQENLVLKGNWKDRVDKTFRDFDDCDGLISLDAVQKIKKEFDGGNSSLAPLMMKLYVLQLSRFVNSH